MNATSGPTAIVQAFDQEHGQPVLFNNWLYAPDGASRDVDWMGILMPPPKDDFERLTNICHYHEGRLQMAVAAFDEKKHYLSMWKPNDEDAAERELLALQKVVKIRRTDLEVAQRLLAATPEAKRRAAAKLQDARNAANKDSFKERIKSIEI